MMVPSGWSIGTINDIAKVTSGGTPSRKIDSYWNGVIPWVTTAEVKFGLITNTEQKITEEGLSNSSAKLFPIDTILIAMYGQGKTRGQVAKLGIEACTNQACAALLLKKDFDTNYYYQYLISQYENIRELANSGGQQNLSAGIIKSIVIPLPPLPEQRKIAKILYCWDKSIATTEKLIAASKQQKKALMQQLLTGKKRFAGFEDEWEEVLLGDIASKVMVGIACAATHAYSSSGIRMLRNLNIKEGWIDDSDILHINENYEQQHKNKRLKTGDILTVRTGYPGLSAVVTKQYNNAQCFTSLITRINKNRAYSEYVCLYINSEYGKKFITSGEAGGAQKNVNASMLKKMPLSLPSLEEQQKIAEVLTAADKEIELLEQKLSHLKNEKKALMQQLLTGKRRVSSLSS